MGDSEKTLTRREWRKNLKKMQRKRKRQKSARTRDAKAEEEQANKEQDPEYQKCLKEQLMLMELEQKAEELRHAEEEEAWLRREAIAQHQFGLEKAKRAQDEAKLELRRLQVAAEVAAREAALRKCREASERLAEAAAAEFEMTMQHMQKFLDNGQVTAAPPLELQRFTETRPGQKLCEFFERTNSCRFGVACTCNHRRPILSKIVLIRHFFTHAMLQQSERGEYAASDEALEMSERDLRNDFDVFFADVVPEMEKFGKVINFRAVRNVLSHLRGHVFVEFEHERAALNAFINLQGRYYASRRLNAEFSNLKTWRGAVCAILNIFKGLSLKRKCTKGYNCGFLHLFKNPNNKYNVLLESTHSTPGSSIHNKDALISRTPSWLSIDQAERKAGIGSTCNWRWSESPEVDVIKSTVNEPSKQKPNAKTDTKFSSHQSKSENVICNSTKNGKATVRKRSSSPSPKSHSSALKKSSSRRKKRKQRSRSRSRSDERRHTSKSKRKSSKTRHTKREESRSRNDKKKRKKSKKRRSKS